MRWLTLAALIVAFVAWRSSGDMNEKPFETAAAEQEAPLEADAPVAEPRAPWEAKVQPSPAALKQAAEAFVIERPGHIMSSVGPQPDEAAPPALVEKRYLAAELQRELQRLGCYAARIDNQWGPRSRRALATFSRLADQKIDSAAPSEAAIATLRIYANGFCLPGCREADGVTLKQRCQTAARGEVKVARADPRDAAPPATAADDRSYLPPSMRGEKPAAAADEAEPALAAPKAKPAADEPVRRAAYEPRPGFGQKFDFNWPGQ